MKTLAITIGREYTTWGVLDNDLNIESKWSDHFSVLQRDQVKVIYDIAKKAREIIDDEKDIEGISVQINGTVDYKTGIFVDPPSYFKNLSNIPLESIFKKECGNIDINIINSAHAATIAETGFGKLQNEKFAVLINIGACISGGIVINGKLQFGAVGSSGEFGKQIIDGVRWEEKASSRALVNKAVLMLGREDILPSNIPTIVKENKILYEEYEYWNYELAKGVANIILTLNPKKIVFSGGITTDKNFTLEPLIRYLRKFVRDEVLSSTIIEISNYGGSGVLIGGVVRQRELYEYIQIHNRLPF